MPTVIERYPATVTNNEDPDKLGRVKVKSLQLMGDETVEYPDFIDPAFDWGWFYVPDVGEEIEIEVVVKDDQSEGVPGQAFLEQPRPRWRNKRFSSDEGEAPRPPNGLFTSKNYGKRRGFATPNGHVLLFDDTPGDESIILTWKKNGEEKFTQISFDKEGSIVLLTHNSMLLHLNAKEGKEGTTVLDKHGNLLATDKDGIKVADKHSNIIELKDGAVQVTAAGDLLAMAGGNIVASSGGTAEKVKIEVKGDGNLDVTAEADVKVTCAAAKIDADTYDLGKGADAPAMRHTDWQAWAAAHVHPTAFGPSGPPTPPPPASIASTIGKVK